MAMVSCCQWPYSAIVAAIFAILGAVLIIIGGSLVPVFNNKFSEETNREIKDREQPSNDSSDAYKAWLNWSHFEPTYRSFYLFNVSNPEEVVRTGGNLAVREIGPYVYRVNFERVNVSFAKNQTRLSYGLSKTYTFDRNKSTGHESDILTVVNLPILNLATRLMYENSTVNEMLADEISRFKQGLFSRVNVSDVLWGYVNDKLPSILDFLSGYFGIHPLNDSTYGLMYQSGQAEKVNYQGEFQTSTGSDDIGTMWNVKEWNGHSSLTFWAPNSTSNDIKGTEGYSWPARLDLSGDQFIFDSEWCRSIRMAASGGESVGPLSTTKYLFPDDTFSYKGENKGFCQPTPKKGVKCLDDGVLNNTKCKDNIPLLLSQPHFLGASDSYRKAVHGISPDQQKHSTTFNLEPWSGEVVEADRKLQLNAYVKRLESFPDTRQFNDTQLVVPVAWMNEIYRMTAEEKNSLSDLTNNIVRIRRIYDGVQYGLIVLGAVILICAIIAFIYFWVRHKKAGDEERQPLLAE